MPKTSTTLTTDFRQIESDQSKNRASNDIIIIPLPTRIPNISLMRGGNSNLNEENSNSCGKKGDVSSKLEFENDEENDDSGYYDDGDLCKRKRKLRIDPKDMTEQQKVERR